MQSSSTGHATGVPDKPQAHNHTFSTVAPRKPVPEPQRFDPRVDLIGNGDRGRNVRLVFVGKGPG